MTNLGTPVRRRLTVEELLRTTLNKILEDEVKERGIKTAQPVSAIELYDKVTISHTEPVITTTTIATDNYDAATALYETSEYS